MRRLKKKIISDKAIQKEKLPEPGFSSTEKIDAIIRKDFERYKAVFKALA